MVPQDEVEPRFGRRKNTSGLRLLQIGAFTPYCETVERIIKEIYRPYLSFLPPFAVDRGIDPLSVQL